MDIRNWGVGSKLQLPDCCFGQRWPIQVAFKQVGIGTQYDISEMALPDICVIWYFSVFFWAGTTANCRLKLALGDRLPATTVEFNALDPLFKDIGLVHGTNRYLTGIYQDNILQLPMKKLVYAQGRRLIGRWVIDATGTYPCLATIVVSSVPNEVPDCLISR